MSVACDLELSSWVPSDPLHKVGSWVIKFLLMKTWFQGSVWFERKLKKKEGHNFLLFASKENKRKLCLKLFLIISLSELKRKWEKSIKFHNKIKKNKSKKNKNNNNNESISLFWSLWFSHNNIFISFLSLFH